MERIRKLQTVAISTAKQGKLVGPNSMYGVHKGYG